MVVVHVLTAAKPPAFGEQVAQGAELTANVYVALSIHEVQSVPEESAEPEPAVHWFKNVVSLVVVHAASTTVLVSAVQVEHAPPNPSVL